MRNRLSRALPVAVAAAALAAVSALPVSAAAATTTAVTAAVREPVPHAAPADHPTYIVTVQRGVDPAVIADAFGITPVHVYRDVTNGFAARLSPEQVDALRTTAVVESVEEDGGASSFGVAV